MTVAVRARFDGKVFVPDEPVDLPVGPSGVFLSSRLTSQTGGERKIG
jgi:hypothetical protein